MICFSSLGLSFCMFKMHVRLLGFLFWGFALFLVFLRFSGKTHVRIILPAYAGLIMCIQACFCVHKPLPRNPNFCFLFVLLLLSHVCLFSFFSHTFMLSMPMFHMFNYLVCYHKVELGYILCFIVLMTRACIHMLMYKCHRC